MRAMSVHRWGLQGVTNGFLSPCDGPEAALEAERVKPVIAINAATYWHALRANGIDDRHTGFGRLLAEY